jgi:predicted GTPase
MMRKNPLPVVVLLGSLGQGKTCTFNKITGQRGITGAGFATVTAAASCHLSTNREFFVIDTPGLEESENTAMHMAALMAALQTTPVSAVFLVVKIEKADVVANKITRVLNILNQPDLVRVILTYADLYQFQNRFDSGQIEGELLRSCRRWNGGFRPWQATCWRCPAVTGLCLTV